MASISISFTDVSRTLTLTVVETEVLASSNASVVTWSLTSAGDGAGLAYYCYASVNGNVIFNNNISTDPSVFPSTTGTRTGTLTIAHNNDGTKAINFYLEGCPVPNAVQSQTGTLTLTNIDRTAPVITASDAYDTTGYGAKVLATANVGCRVWGWRYCYANNLVWSNWTFTPSAGTSYEFDVALPQPNQNYIIQVCAEGQTTGKIGYSRNVYARTSAGAMIISADDITLGTQTEVRYKPSVTGMKYSLRFVINTWIYETDKWTVSGISEQTATYTVPLSVASEITNSTERQNCLIQIVTYTANDELIERDGVRVTAFVPASVVPTISNVTIEEGAEQSGYDLFVKTLSSMLVTFGASGAYGSTIRTVTLDIDGTIYTPEKITGQQRWTKDSDPLTTYNETTGIPVTITVIDSRGRTAVYSVNEIVYDYFIPALTVTTSVYGTTVKTVAKGKIAPVDNLNSKRLTFVRKKVIDGTTQTYSVNPLSSYDFEVTWTQTLADAERESYEYTVTAYDRDNSTTVVLSTGVVCLSRYVGGRGLTLFGEAKGNGFFVVDSTTGDYIGHQIRTADYLELADMVADEYAQKDYFEGEWCKKDGYIYEAKADITAESWQASHWEQLGVAT